MATVVSIIDVDFNARTEEGHVRLGTKVSIESMKRQTLPLQEGTEVVLVDEDVSCLARLAATPRGLIAVITNGSLAREGKGPHTERG